MLTCMICGYTHETMIHYAHVRKHGITTEDYKKRFPGSALRIQTEESRKKSSASKKGKPSNLLGRSFSEEHRRNISKSVKERTQQDSFVHWNSGRTTPDSVKKKISDSNKNIVNIGNIRQRQGKHDRIKTGAEMFNCTVLRIDDNISRTTAICNTCKNTFSFTSQIFYPNRLAKSKKLCPSCAPRVTYASKSEIELLNFIKTLDPHCIPNDRSLLNGKEIDILCKGQKIGFEFTGLFWHAEKQNPSVLHLQEKFVKMENLGYRLITVFEDEWKEYRGKVENLVARALQVGQKIDSQYCKCRLIDNKEAEQFCAENSFSVFEITPLTVGVFNSGSLIAIASFYQTINEVQISNFCVKLGFVSDCLDRMMSFNGGTSFVINTDNRWGEGDYLKSIGFIAVDQGIPKKWATDYKSRQLTEGQDSIWDCGTTKWKRSP